MAVGQRNGIVADSGLEDLTKLEDLFVAINGIAGFSERGKVIAKLLPKMKNVRSHGSGPFANREWGFS